jgi:DNA-binding CsgD family transcriptional regulator
MPASETKCPNPRNPRGSAREHSSVIQVAHTIGGARKAFEREPTGVRTPVDPTFGVEVTRQLSNHNIRSAIGRLYASVQEICTFDRSKLVADKPTPRRLQRRLSPSQVAELIRAYQSGTTLNGLAEHFRIHRSTVLNHLNRANTPRRRYPALKPDEIDEAAHLYESGKSLREVGLSFDVHASTVRAALLRRRIKMRDCQGRER